MESTGSGDRTVYRKASATARPPHHRAARKAGGWAARHFFEGLARAGKLHPRSDPELHGLEVLRDLSYAPAHSLADREWHLLDIYRPAERTGPLPTVLYIHGGAFQALSKNTHWIMGLALARAGYLVVSINYRLAPEHKFPAAVQDVARAYVWAVDQVAAFGGDPSRLIVAGESAGANLAASLTVMSCFDRPEPWARDVLAAPVAPIACLPACGLLQVSDSERFARRRPLSRLVRDQIEGCEDAYLHGARTGPGGTGLADPLLVLESDAQPIRPLPPFFALVGTRDPLLDDTRRLEAALLARDVPVEARYYPGGPHAFHALPMLPNARQSWADQFAFLDHVLAGVPPAVHEDRAAIAEAHAWSPRPTRPSSADIAGLRASLTGSSVDTTLGESLA